MPIRAATSDDVKTLASLNQGLIRDSGHRNPMSLAELEERMSSWLASEYKAVLFEEQGCVLGYVLYRHDPEFTYLRQLFVMPEARRRGIGRELVNWLKANESLVNNRLRMDVLIANTEAIEFWRAVGFKDYCLTLEME
jgi:ribosomal protein S18 acetylase RimI-like enzyme